MSERPIITITKTVGSKDARVSITNYNPSLSKEIRENNKEVMDREIDLAIQATKQLNDLTITGDTNESKN